MPRIKDDAGEIWVIPLNGPEEKAAEAIASELELPYDSFYGIKVTSKAHAQSLETQINERVAAMLTPHVAAATPRAATSSRKKKT